MFKLKAAALESLLNSQAVQKFFSSYLPAQISLPCAFLIKEMQDAYEIYAEKKREVLEKYCDRDQEGNIVFVGDNKNQYSFQDNRKILEEELTILINTEIEIRAEKPVIDLELLEEKSDVKLSPYNIIELSLLIDFVGEEGGKEE